jgi:hypothetical protein
MTKTINIDGQDYTITDEQTIHSGEVLVFEIRNYSDKDSKFTIGHFDDLLGSPIKKVWKILQQD